MVVEPLNQLSMVPVSSYHMMVAFGEQVTNVLPLYLMLGWLWAQAFGVTELSLGLSSSLEMSIACVIMWITLRRNYHLNRLSSEH